MNVLRGIINNKRGLKFIENNLKILFQHNFMNFMHEPYAAKEFELAYKNYSREAYTIKAFNFSVFNTYIYSNDFGICVVTDIIHDITLKKHRISMQIGR